MNVLDSELVGARLLGAGHELVPAKEEADVILYNTCSVREHAEERVLSNAGKTKHLCVKRPDLVVGIIGCMPEARQEGIFERLPHVRLIVGPRKAGAIPRLIEEVRRTGQRRVAIRDFDEEFIDGLDAVESRAGQFKSYVKVMEGCDLSCSFCVVPAVRGREVSRPPDVIVEEVRRLAGRGCVEATLLGQTVNSYGKGLKPRTNLAELLHRVHEVDGIRRIRFITSHPALMNRGLVEAMRDLPKVCRYLHLPVQSGSDRVLKAMRRLHTRARYLEILSELRETVPGIEVASDFIVGFPGETDDEFEETVSLVKEARFQNIFVFKYSPRPGTAAADLPDDVPGAEKKRRNNHLLQVQMSIAEERNQRHVGKRVEVLVEGPSKTRPQRQTGRTGTWQIVNFDADGDLRGRFIDVEIASATALSLSGKRAP
jgi:tRNA-2-methylthio-N6-dimethylallyladenosine synthase